MTTTQPFIEDQSQQDANLLPPSALAVAYDLARIRNTDVREKVIAAIRVMLLLHFPEVVEGTLETES